MMMYMDIAPYTEQISGALVAATRSLSEANQQLAAQLCGAVDPAARLAIMEAISQASAEISAALPSGRVDVRLVGRDLAFDIAQTQPAPPAPDEDDNLARFTLRLPESLKARAEQCAADQGQSLNTWLVGVIRTATTHTAGIFIDATVNTGGRKQHGGNRMSGWI
jgi:hypothetical protein